MATVTQFEDLQIWQEARTLVKDIYDLTKGLKDYGFVDQIRRASVSVMNNIAEGFERGSNREFIRFLNISKASCAEVRSMLYLSEDLGYLETIKVDDLRKFCFNLSTSLNKFINYLESHKPPLK